MPKSFSRSQSDASATFLLHLQRFAVDCSVGYTPDGSCPVEKEAVTLAEVFGSGVFDGRMEKVSLTGNTGDFGGQLLTSDPITVQPMEIQGYLLTLGDEH
ncbi:unnamed protein product [Cyprideis torosa]|uniref:Uncharacterized protein n=1 Tax=Cyprideis torosa TaxID=163714 RepID=A0A7R8ZMW0_9CRUS|nr:unnamed protein product [Cyprideis torosa]CAG0889992.1 unnamed protein product [Cyprideis torosa]